MVLCLAKSPGLLSICTLSDLLSQPLHRHPWDPWIIPGISCFIKWIFSYGVWSGYYNLVLKIFIIYVLQPGHKNIDMLQPGNPKACDRWTSRLAASVPWRLKLQLKAVFTKDFISQISYFEYLLGVAWLVLTQNSILSFLSDPSLIIGYACQQGCISCGILLSGTWARGVSSEHMENMDMFSCSPT